MRWIILTLLCSCASITIESSSDDSYKPHVAKFEEYYGKSVGSVEISIGRIYDNGRINPNVGAVCYMLPPRKVVFNEQVWNRSSLEYREMLVFHELGHCVLNRHHTDLDEDYKKPRFLEISRCPESIMHSGTTVDRMTDTCYIRFREYYILELFMDSRIRKLLYGSGR